MCANRLFFVYTAVGFRVIRKINIQSILTGRDGNSDCDPRLTYGDSVVQWSVSWLAAQEVRVRSLAPVLQLPSEA